jgi:hypothetical protein
MSWESTAIRYINPLIAVSLSPPPLSFLCLHASKSQLKGPLHSPLQRTVTWRDRRRSLGLPNGREDIEEAENGGIAEVSEKKKKGYDWRRC